MGTIPDYDPRVIEQFADKLYRKASSFVIGAIAVGASVGAGFGAVPLTSLGAAWPIPQPFGLATMLIGGLLGALVGYVVGDARAFSYRLQAQSALCQLQAERNAHATAEVLKKVVESATKGPSRRAAEPAQPAAKPQQAPPAARPAPPVAVPSPPQASPAPRIERPAPAPAPAAAPWRPAAAAGAPVPPPLTPPVSS